MEPGHTPVMPREILEYIQGLPRSVSLAVDGTAGGGGHTRLIAEAFPEASVLAFERDPSSAEALRSEFHGTRVRVFPESYTGIPAVIEKNALPPADAAVFDLGLSSIQLDSPERGFSHRTQGPLDMRFDTTQGQPLGEILGSLTEKEIADIIYRYGEEGRSRAIARSIRRSPSMKTTGDLAEAVRHAVKGNPVKALSRVFQAFRIFVNGELDHLEKLLGEMHLWTAPGSRVAILTFHSLEDRMVKLHFRDSEHFRQFEPPWMVPGREEKARNGRARSARLRLGVRL